MSNENINSAKVDLNRQAWLRSLKQSDPVMVHIKNEPAFESTVINARGGILEVEGGGANLQATGRRRNGRFSKVHGHRNSHSPYADYWQTDYISPVTAHEEISLEEKDSLVKPIMNKQKQVIGFEINSTPFSKLEAELIYKELGRFLN